MLRVANEWSSISHIAFIIHSKNEWNFQFRELDSHIHWRPKIPNRTSIEKHRIRCHRIIEWISIEQWIPICRAKFWEMTPLKTNERTYPFWFRSFTQLVLRIGGLPWANIWKKKTFFFQLSTAYTPCDHWFRFRCNIVDNYNLFISIFPTNFCIFFSAVMVATSGASNYVTALAMCRECESVIKQEKKNTKFVCVCQHSGCLSNENVDVLCVWCVCERTMWAVSWVLRLTMLLFAMDGTLIALTDLIIRSLHVRLSLYVWVQIV